MKSVRPSSLAKRAAILAAAEEAFLSATYDAVRVDEIAERAGVAKQTAYAHFGSKKVLFVELVTSMTRGAGDVVLAERPNIASVDELAPALVKLLDRQLTTVLTPRLLRLRRLVIGEVARFPELARTLAEHGPQRAIDLLTDLLTEVDARELLSIADPRTAASQLNWLVMGAPINDAMLLGDDAVPGATARRRHVRAAVSTFLRAYGAPETGA